MREKDNSADVQTITPKRGTWRTYTPTDGLVGSPWRFCQDRYGYIWFGSHAGLCRYDGRQFVTHTTEDGLASDWVFAICEDRLDRLWIGTGGGISCYDGHGFIAHPIVDATAGKHVRAVHHDRQGNLWVGTWADGVFCYDASIMGHEAPRAVDLSSYVVQYTTEDGLADNRVSVIYGDALGRLWFGAGIEYSSTPGGVTCFDGNRWTVYTTEDGLAHTNVTDIYLDDAGNVWFCSSFAEKGLTRFDGTRFTIYTTEDGLPANDAISVCSDPSGNLWFGVFGGGMCCYESPFSLQGSRRSLSARASRNRFTTYTTADGLLDNRMHHLRCDREGHLWMMHFHSGVTRFDPQTMELLKETPVTETLIQTREGHFWFGSSNDLCHFFNGQ